MSSLRAAWWRRRAVVNDNLADLSALNSAEMDRVAQDIGLSRSDLWSLAARSPEEADFLDRRLAAVGLDPLELARSAPAERRDMERLCTLCETKWRCSYDLAAAPRDPAWRQYCPNQATIAQLAEQRAPLRHP